MTSLFLAWALLAGIVQFNATAGGTPYCDGGSLVTVDDCNGTTHPKVCDDASGGFGFSSPTASGDYAMLKDSVSGNLLVNEETVWTMGGFFKIRADECGLSAPDVGQAHMVMAQWGSDSAHRQFRVAINTNETGNVCEFLYQNTSESKNSGTISEETWYVWVITSDGGATNSIDLYLRAVSDCATNVWLNQTLEFNADDTVVDIAIGNHSVATNIRYNGDMKHLFYLEGVTQWVGGDVENFCNDPATEIAAEIAAETEGADSFYLPMGTEHAAGLTDTSAVYDCLTSNDFAVEIGGTGALSDL